MCTFAKTTVWQVGQEYLSRDPWNIPSIQTHQIHLSCNCIIISRVVLNYVITKNMAGASPLRCSPDGGISAEDFKILLTAYESYLRIKQINAEVHDNNHTLLSKWVNNTMCNCGKLACLLKWLQKASVTNPWKNKGSIGWLIPTYLVGMITGNYS